MKKSAAAKDLYTLLNLYSDYIETGFTHKYNTPDFAYLDIPQEKEMPKKVSAPVMPQLPTDTKKRKIIEVAEKILKCRGCALCEGVGKVPGAGNVDAKVFVVSLPPTPEEEKAKRPLVGENGIFFKKWVSAIGLDFDELFITNILKCPLKNRKISKAHVEMCLKVLDKQLEIVRPQVILSLGQLPLSSLQKAFVDINRKHGTFFEYNKIPFMPTYHPAEVLTNQSLKKLVWDDLKKLNAFLKEIE